MFVQLRVRVDCLTPWREGLKEFDFKKPLTFLNISQVSPLRSVGVIINSHSLSCCLHACKQKFIQC